MIRKAKTSGLSCSQQLKVQGNPDQIPLQKNLVSRT